MYLITNNIDKTWGKVFVENLSGVYKDYKTCYWYLIHGKQNSTKSQCKRNT